ncbi:carbonate dehydratase [Corallococcus sp. Z5C101001]|uniref:carbonate dehydratase n=1 Tax=Corallococcus sp. Z5C101001 TaxID=2596829 RepID=UPI00117F76B0|nr:carbonate dehydratase [Corallococcus sp. Z5C101001]TSC25225.1 carbonate dehydratase [Corallococcus sp. Z5C101001]
MTDPNAADPTLDALFENNRQWAASMVEKDADFFRKMASHQSPEYLWIGCSDSRVPANQIVNLMAGDLFVHRNIANVVVHTDLNALSVLQFAIDLLRVRHVIVCGHYGCSGVRAALERKRVGLADNWLRHIQDVHQKHERLLGEGLSPRERHDRLGELNVLEQVQNVSHTTIVQDAWERGQPLTVHGWIYGVEDGLLKDLGLTLGGPDELAAKLPGCLARYASAPAPAPEPLRAGWRP